VQGAINLSLHFKIKNQTMEIKIQRTKEQDKLLIIRANNSAKEDLLIQKWHDQIIDYLNKIDLE
jgi:hypothetical protein